MKLHNGNEDMWMHEFTEKWKVETEHVQTKCQCMQAKFAAYYILFRGFTLILIHFMEK